MYAFALGMLAFLVAGDAPSTTGPPESPFSWTHVGETNAQQFAPDARVLGLAKQPSMISVVDFHDERPYAELADARAWLVRYDGVTIPAPENGPPPVPITVFLVFRQPSGELLAAFTEAKPMWAKQGWTSKDITKRVRCEFFPPESTALRSSITDVLRAIQEEGVNLVQSAQITIRPRQFMRKATIRDESGKPIPQVKTNGWIVEVLGTQNGVSRFGPTNTYVVVFRDGDLAFSGGLRL